MGTTTSSSSSSAAPPLDPAPEVGTTPSVEQAETFELVSTFFTSFQLPAPEFTQEALMEKWVEARREELKQLAISTAESLQNLGVSPAIIARVMQGDFLSEDSKEETEEDSPPPAAATSAEGTPTLNTKRISTRVTALLAEQAETTEAEEDDRFSERNLKRISHRLASFIEEELPADERGRARTLSVADTAAVSKIAEKLVMGIEGGGSLRKISEQSITSSVVNDVPGPLATAGWKKYVDENLPLERLNEETPEEQEFSAKMMKATENGWEEVPHDLRLMLLRGYADKKDRMGATLEAFKYVTEWRVHTKSDDLLKTALPEEETFFRAWATTRAGEDQFGHVVISDRIETINLGALVKLDDGYILRMRTKQMEVLRRLKLECSERRGARVCKHVYIMDLAGLNVRKHFTPRVKNLLSSIFKVGGEAYPDSLWQLWLINTPFTFQMIWKMISPTLEAVTKAKIRMMGGKSAYLPEMEKCGIPLSSVPKEFGGEFESENLFETLKEMISRDRM